ncbi:unnamed protein product [Paramecium octaurelia]|uniref:Uncharacterized protein n=1 Tax=Paramecium octaurelia TaxID=43137 RepID=A0A8S1YQU1_PAROT|nr:unnamed protein product [Paramecium octaurelia]
MELFEQYLQSFFHLHSFYNYARLDATIIISIQVENQNLAFIFTRMPTDNRKSKVTSKRITFEGSSPRSIQKYYTFPSKLVLTNSQNRYQSQIFFSPKLPDLTTLMCLIKTSINLSKQVQIELYLINLYTPLDQWAGQLELNTNSYALSVFPQMVHKIQVDCIYKNQKFLLQIIFQNCKICPNSSTFLSINFKIMVNEYLSTFQLSHLSFKYITFHSSHLQAHYYDLRILFETFLILFSKLPVSTSNQDLKIFIINFQTFTKSYFQDSINKQPNNQIQPTIYSYFHFMRLNRSVQERMILKKRTSFQIILIINIRVSEKNQHNDMNKEVQKQDKTEFQCYLVVTINCILDFQFKKLKPKYFLNLDLYITLYSLLNEINIIYSISYYYLNLFKLKFEKNFVNQFIKTFLLLSQFYQKPEQNIILPSNLKFILLFKLKKMSYNSVTSGNQDYKISGCGIHIPNDNQQVQLEISNDSAIFLANVERDLGNVVSGGHFIIKLYQLLLEML